MQIKIKLNEMELCRANIMDFSKHFECFNRCLWAVCHKLLLPPQYAWLLYTKSTDGLLTASITLLTALFFTLTM